MLKSNCTCRWCANCWRCVSGIQSRTLLPTDAQNFTRTWKAVIKGWHISAPLPLCVGWPEIELQGFNRHSTPLHRHHPASQRGKWILPVFISLPIFSCNSTKWSDGQAWSGMVTGKAEEPWASSGVTKSEMAAQTRTNGRSERSVSGPSLWCARGAAGQAAAHVLPRLLLVIHKLRLIPVVWCHLHHLPMDLVFNMGAISFHRAFCLEGLHVCYICACAYLFVRACACVLMCPCACVRENRRESVAMHFYMSSHWSLHMKHHGRAELNT